MERLTAFCFLWSILATDYGLSLPLQRGWPLIARLKRGNVYDPPAPVFPSKENAPFWNPAPYPVPVATEGPATPRRKLSHYDPNNPYLDPMTNPYWPNFGLGYANGVNNLVGGSINWPTGNMLMPSDHFNGTFGAAIKPDLLNVGMQGGPLYPYQSPRYVKTVSDINDATMVQQMNRVQSDASGVDVGSGQGAPTGFIPVQQQFLAQQQSPQFDSRDTGPVAQRAPILAQDRPLQQAPRRQDAHSGLHRTLSFAGQQ